MEDPNDPLEQLKRMKAQPTEVDPLEQLKAMRKQPSIHDQFKSGALQRKNVRLNTNDIEQAQAADAEAQPGIAASIADAAQGIPGVGAAEAGIRSVVRGQPYKDAYRDITNQTDKVPASAKIVGRVATAAPLMGVLPGSAALSGAIIGGADQALDANPNEGMGTRAIKTAVGAVGGAALGKATEAAFTLPRALMASVPAENVAAREAARAVTAGKMYRDALASGAGKPPTAATSAFLAQPDIAEIVGELQMTRPFHGVQAHEPEMLDAVYKTLSDRVSQAKKGLESISPSRPNIGRYRKADAQAAQSDLLNAVETPAHDPQMVGYRPAVQDYARQSADISGVKTGYDALRAKLSKALPAAANLTRTTPQALADWGTTATDAMRKAAGEGVMGATKDALGKSLLGIGRHAVFEAPKLMRAVRSPAQAAIDHLVQAGLLSADAGTHLLGRNTART